MIRNCHDAVYVGGMHEHRRAGESAEAGENFHQLREAAIAKSQRGGGKECPGIAAGGVDMLPAAAELDKPDHFEV